MKSMNQQEIDIIMLLENIYQKFSALEEQHYKDKEEFIQALHVLQHLIMIRGVRREYPDLFPLCKINEHVIQIDTFKELLSNKQSEDIQ